MNSVSALLDTEAARPFAGQRVLLTGASGFLGGHIARQALTAGVELHTLGRSAGPAGASHHQADLTDREEIARVIAAARPQAVIHCAAPGVAYGTMEFAGMLAVAAGGTEALLAACAALDQPPRVALAGSGFEYAQCGQPVAEDWPIVPAGSHYGAAKAAAACVAGAFADRLPLTLLRPFHIYGGGEAPRRLGPYLIAEARAGRPVELTACEQQRDFLHVDDCGAMIWAALAAAGAVPGLDVLNIGSGQPITLRTYVELIGAELARHGVTAQCRIGALPYRSLEPMVSLPVLKRWQATGLRAARISLETGVADLVRVELER